MIWMWIGIIVGLLGFIGVLVSAFLAKQNPSMQPVATACAVVMLIGIGTYMYVYWNKSDFEAAEAAAKQKIFTKAMYNKMGAELKGKKVVLFTSNSAEDENFKANLEVLKAAGCSDVTVISTQGAGEAAEPVTINFKDELAKLGKEDVALIDCEGDGELTKAITAGKCKFAFTPSGTTALMGIDEKKMENVFKKGTIVFVIKSAANADSEYEPDEENLEEAFTKQYKLIKAYDKAEFENM